MDAEEDVAKNWVETQIVWPSLSRWRADSTKLHENVSHQHLLVLCVDSTVIETTDTSDTPMHRAQFNAKTDTQGWVVAAVCTPCAGQLYTRARVHLLLSNVLSVRAVSLTSQRRWSAQRVKVRV